MKGHCVHFHSLVSAEGVSAAAGAAIPRITTPRVAAPAAAVTPSVGDACWYRESVFIVGYRINARPEGWFDPWTWEVTIYAAGGQQEGAGVGARQTLGRARNGGVPRAFVTALAEEGRAHLEQRRLRGTVRLVTVAAVLRHRLMLPQERPAVFGMAARAGFIDGVLHQLRRRRRTMRRMTGGAGHLAFPQGMMRRLEQIGVLGLMTGGADFDLTRRGQHRILRLVQRMAACACHIVSGVRARCPIVGRVRLMTVQAFGVLLRGGCVCFAAEIDDARQLTHRRHVRASRSVTGLALQPAVTEGSARVVRAGMLGAEDADDGGVVVTGETGIGSLRAVAGAGRRPRLVGRRERGGGTSEQQGQRSGRPASSPTHSNARRGNVGHGLHHW